MVNPAVFSSANDQWLTPPEIVERVQRCLGVIDLDPCSDGHNIPARKHYTTGGLDHHWYGAVYMNPPHDRTIGLWVHHLIQEYQFGHVREAIALLPARTDTKWFHELAPYPRCFVRGRLKLSGRYNSAPFPSMIVCIGIDLQRFAEIFQDLGGIYISLW